LKLFVHKSEKKKRNLCCQLRRLRGSVIDDIKRNDFVASVGLTEAQGCGPRFMRDFAAACRTMLPLVEFTARALGLKA
jgi:hypothetical protein